MKSVKSLWRSETGRNPMKVGRFWIRAQKRPLIPRSAARTRDHTPRNGACETGELSISDVTGKAKQIKRGGSIYGRSSRAFYFLWALANSTNTSLAMWDS